MKHGALALALLTPALARAADPPAAPPQETDASPPPPFVYPALVRTLVGLGRATRLPKDDDAPSVVMTVEVGEHPLGGALGTGISLSSALDSKGLWSVVTPGLFATLDLTYLFLSGLWAYEPPPFAGRLRVGSRLGIAVSESYRPSGDVPYAPPYMLIRPELQSFVDLEWPLDRRQVYSLVGRAAIDTSVNLSDAFRWSFSAGIDYAWGQ
ncbi:MAG TPA: hypothetical protein VGM06_14075 [Polyangiaceae bacterium]|jgi:hypothetical protein